MKHGEVMKYREGMEDDKEEELIKQLFKDFNMCRQNQSSFTVFIENELSFLWDKIFEARYGSPINKGIHGFHWTHKGYSFDEILKSNIYVRKYHEPKNDKSSKIVIQGNFTLAIAFVTDELP